MAKLASVVIRGCGPCIGLLSVGETVRILGISPSTLRLWENVGLIMPVCGNGRYRFYSFELLEVLKRIKYLRDVKLLNLLGIKQMFGKTAVVRMFERSRPTDVGPKLRWLRKKVGLGVVEVAKRSKVSAGFLSAIELSRVNLLVATLQRFASTYGATVLDFFDLPKQFSRLIRPRDRCAIQIQSGVRIELLSIGVRQLESQLFCVPFGAGSDGSYSYQGEEFIYMLAGSLEIWFDELECYTLQQGDSFWFESIVGHRWFNLSTEEAVLLWINIFPIF